MTNARREVQAKHERFVVNDFLQKFNHRHHCDYRVIEEPNPPEAVIQCKRSTSWVEVTCAFWTDEWAKDKYSFATEGETHTPVREGGYANMTHIFANRFVDVVRKKLEKPTYVAARDLYGPGYLVVSIQNPFFDKSDLPHMQRAWSKLDVNDLGCFRSIYLHYQVFNFYVLTKWAPEPTKS